MQINSRKNTPPTKAQTALLAAFGPKPRPAPAAQPTTPKAQALGALLGNAAHTPPGKQSGEVAQVRPTPAAPSEGAEVAQAAWGEGGPPLWDDSPEVANAALPPAMTKAPKAPIDAMSAGDWAQWWAAYHPGVPNPDSAQPLAIAQAAYAQAESTPPTAAHPQAPDTRQTVGKQSATLGRNLGARPTPRPKLPNAQTPAGRLMSAAWASIAGEAGYIPNAPLSAQPAALGAAWVAYVVAGKHAPSTPQAGGEVA